jgi:hypothetical protein
MNFIFNGLGQEMNIFVKACYTRSEHEQKVLHFLPTGFKFFVCLVKGKIKYNVFFLLL